MKPRRIMLLAAVIVLAGISIWSISSQTVQVPDTMPDMTACTLEALVCPDGSSVGRSGAHCAFSTCPQVPYLVGELEQIGGDFQLILEGDAGGRGGVVPLQVQVSNALGTLVGKWVQAFGRFEMGNIFVVETLTEYQEEANEDAERSEEVSATGEVGYGETVVIDGVSITFRTVEEDSRCPVDVMCITAGTFTADLTLQEGTEETSVLLSAGEVFVFGTREISIDSVSPMPDSRVQIEVSKYVLTLRVD